MMRSQLPVSLAIIASAVAFPAAVSAQRPPEEIVVTGRFTRAPANVRTLSQAVGYADLDLSTAAGRNEMRHRINLTARFLCDKLGENNTSRAVVSCRDDASRDALARLGTIEQSSAPRGTTWVRPPAWHAPYPADWEKKYP